MCVKSMNNGEVWMDFLSVVIHTILANMQRDSNMLSSFDASWFLMFSVDVTLDSSYLLISFWINCVMTFAFQVFHTPLCIKLSAHDVQNHQGCMNHNRKCLETKTGKKKNHCFPFQIAAHAIRMMIVIFFYVEFLFFGSFS